jgi:hypothetical protein
MMAASAHREAQSRAARWLAAWDAHGLHRTATAGDEAGADWLMAEAAALGAEVGVEEFALERLDPVDAFLEIGATRIAAVPVFDAPATGTAGISGRLGPVGGGAEIAVAELSPQAVYSGEFEELRRVGGHRGFVVLCDGRTPGLALLNAERFRQPYGTPAIHVSGEAGGLMRRALARGTPARLVAESRLTPATARNLVIALDGTDSEEPPLVVMTPRSSWWQSTAERGGGIVCWLEALRALLAAPPAQPVVFTANSGHELGHLGFDDFLARRPGWEGPARRGGATWVHFGANIGAAAGTLSVASPEDDLAELAAAELVRVRQACNMTERSRVPNGETRDIHLAGGRCLALVGDNRLFHLPQDRWPGAVDLAAVARIAAGAAGIVLALTRGGRSADAEFDNPGPMRVIRLGRDS